MVRIRFYQQRAGPPPILFRAIPWFAPLSEPVVKAPRRLLEADQQAFAFTGKPPAYFYPIPFVPRPNEPNPTTKPGLPTSAQQAYAGKIYPYFYPLPFLPQLSEPIVKTKPLLSPHLQQFEADPAPPIFVPIPWFAPLSEPVVKTAPRLLEAYQQSYAGPGPVPILYRSIDWFGGLSEPVRTSPRLPAALHLTVPGFLAQPPPALITIPWFILFPGPVAKPSLSAAQHQTFAAPIATAPVFFQDIPWYVPLSEPVRVIKFTERQQSYTGPIPVVPLPWLVHQKVMRVRTPLHYGTQGSSPSPPPPPPKLGFLQPASTPPRKAPALGDENSAIICFPGITDWPIAPWVRVQGLCSNSATVALTAVTTGNLIVGVVGWTTTSGTITLNSITDNAGNTYIITNNISDAVNSKAAAAFVLGNIGNHPTQFTANFSSAPTTTSICVTEYFGGLASNDPRDGNTAQFQVTPSPSIYDALSSGSVSTTQPGDLIWGAYAVTNGGTVQPFAGTRFNLRDHNSANILLATEDQRQVNAGTVATTFTDTSSQSAITFVIAIKPSFFPTRWYQPWVDPVRPKQKHYYSDLAWAGPNFQLAPTAFPNWFSALSEPKRTPARLIEGCQQTYANNPAPSFLYPLPFLPQLSEPIVKTPRQLPGYLQQALIAQPPAINFDILPWQFIQGNVAFSSSTANLSASFAAVGLANLVVGVVTYDTVGNTVVLNNVTDNGGGTYFIANNVIDSLNNQGTASFILGNIRNAPTAVTANFNGVTNCAMIISEYAGGLNAADPRDTNVGQQQQSPGTGLNAISSSLALTRQNGDLIWGTNDNTTGNNLLPFAGSGFNLRQSINNANGVLVTEDRVQLAFGLTAATFTRSVNYATSSLMIAIRPASDIQRTYQPLSEPIRRRLPEALYQTYASVAPPVYSASIPWFVPLSEPVRIPARLREAAQSSWAAPNWPAKATTLPWFAPLSEPVRTRPILGAPLNPDISFVEPEVPTIIFALNAVESGDSGNLSVIGFIAPLSVTLSVHETR